MKLYYSPGACSLAPHVLLRWVGADFEAVRADRSDPAYLSINPAAAVPALDTGEGWTLTQAGAVLRYLVRRFPKAGLGGDDRPQEQAEMDRWSSFLTGDFHPAFFPVFMPARYTISGEAAFDPVREAGTQLVRKQLTILDRHLEDRRFMVGNRYSYVDIYALPMLRWAKSKLPDGLTAFPQAAGLLARLQDEAVVREVLRDEGLS